MLNIGNTFKYKLMIILALSPFTGLSSHLQADVIDLTGTWRVALDRNDVGVDREMVYA